MLCQDCGSGWREELETQSPMQACCLKLRNDIPYQEKRLKACSKVVSDKSNKRAVLVARKD